MMRKKSIRKSMKRIMNMMRKKTNRITNKSRRSIMSSQRGSHNHLLLHKRKDQNLTLIRTLVRMMGL
jgi:hypothetical protein